MAMYMYVQSHNHKMHRNSQLNLGNVLKTCAFLSQCTYVLSTAKLACSGKPGWHVIHYNYNNYLVLMSIVQVDPFLHGIVHDGIVKVL